MLMRDNKLLNDTAASYKVRRDITANSESTANNGCRNVDRRI